MGNAATRNNKTDDQVNRYTRGLKVHCQGADVDYLSSWYNWSFSYILGIETGASGHHKQDQMIIDHEISQIPSNYMKQ